MTDPTHEASHATLPTEPKLATAPAEPLITIGAVGTLIVSVIALLVAFGVPITVNQREAIIAVVAAAAPVVTALVGRLKVYSPRSVARLLVAARAAARLSTTSVTPIASPIPPTSSATVTPLNPPLNPPLDHPPASGTDT